MQLAANSVVADPRSAFFSVISDLQAQFSAAAKDIDARETTFKTEIIKLRKLLDAGIGETDIDPSHPLAGQMKASNAQLKEVVTQWLSDVENYDRNTAFRNKLTDSFVVYVLGKVKAGKSSLGNYMAYGSSNPTSKQIATDGSHFFTAATAQDGQGPTEHAHGPGGSFRVGAGETTRSIQGFRVAGLTWVDSPGLHSVTRDNGALAADFTGVADLIIYPMSTSSPGRRGDVEEIRKLLDEEIRVVVVITQCDRVIVDEAPDGTIVQEWVMKNEAARQGQIDHVRRALAWESDAVPIDILSLSVRYAETNGNSSHALEESGVANFFRLLTDIACSQGVKLKREAPSRNLNSFINVVLGEDAKSERLSVVRVRGQLTELEKILTATESEIDRFKNRALASVLERLGPEVLKQTILYASDQNQEGFEQRCADALRRVVAEEVHRHLRTLLAVTSGTVVPANSLADLFGFLKFEKLVIKVPKSNRAFVKQVGKAAGPIVGGLLGGVELGALFGSVVPGFGTAIGAVVGGLGGLLLGVAGGAAADQIFGRDWEESVQSEKDNSAEVEANAVEIMRKASQVAVEDFFKDIKLAVVTSVRGGIGRLVQGLDGFSQILNEKVRSNG